MNRLLKSLLHLIPLLFSAPVYAALISYSYDSPIHNPDGVFAASAIIVVDDQSRSLVSVDFNSAPVDFFWQGSVSLYYDQPVSDTAGRFHNGFKSVYAGDFIFNLYLDEFELDAGEDLFHNLHKTNPWEAAFIADEKLDKLFYLAGGLTKIGVVEVAAPATGVLMTLGLALIHGARRSRRKIRLWQSDMPG